jgi:hypothetical protein
VRRSILASSFGLKCHNSQDYNLLSSDISLKILRIDYIMPVTVAERSKACIVFARSEAGIMGSNPTQGVDV